MEDERVVEQWFVKGKRLAKIAQVENFLSHHKKVTNHLGGNSEQVEWAARFRILS